jgi:hypothetical protein
MTKDQAAREIAGLSPIAIGQAERIFDKAVVGDGRGQRGPQEKIDEANKMRAWATGDGARETMTKRLDQVRGDRITIHHEPGAPAFKRLVAISAGITRELDRQRSAQPQPRQPAPDRAAPPPDRSRNDDRER